MRSLREAGEELAAGVLGGARETGAELAEVFLKSARSLRCEFGTEGILLLQRREENGIALRAWYEGGRGGFVHADDAVEAARELPSRARWCAARSRGGPVPNLPVEPAGDDPGSGLAPSWPCCPRHEDAGEEPLSSRGGSVRPAREIEEQVREAASAILAAPRRGVSLHRGFIEIGETWSRVENTAGGRAAFGRAPIVVGLNLLGADCTAPVSTIWYAGQGEGLESFHPVRFVDKARARAAISAEGTPACAERVTVLLDQPAAAVWVRCLIAFLAAAGAGPFSAQGQEAGGGRRRSGFEILDDPPPPGIDGVGRRARTRVLVRDAAPVERVAAAVGPATTADDPGPMRRDSYRDPPAPGPMRLSVAPGSASREEMLSGIRQGLYVTTLAPYSAPGSGSLVAQVRGAWVERGHAVRPVARTLLVLPFSGRLGDVVARGAEVALDESGVPVLSPALLIEGARLVPI